MLDALIWIGLIALALGAIITFGKAAWRRSEGDYERWQNRRGEDDAPHTDDRGAMRSHWGGWGRPGSGGSGGLG